MQSLTNRILRHTCPGVLASVALALAAACAPVRAIAFEWHVDITPAGELFPALQLSQAPRAASAADGNGDGLVSVQISGDDIPASVRVQIDTAGLREPAVAVAARGHAGTALDLRPRLDWDVGQLRSLDKPRRQTMRITLESDGHVREVRQVDVRLHPLDDALYFVREGRDRVDLGWAFAGYVNPRDPVVDAVLQLARSMQPDFDSLDGLARVGAVWAALERRGLRYADGDPALSRGPVLWSQRVRLLDEIWHDHRANCIDSSILIASVLERLDLRTFIVLVPGHAFVGFGGDAQHRGAYYLETTLLGAKAASGPSANLPGGPNYAAAQRAGRARWRGVAAQFGHRHGPAYALIDIGIARAYGIIPLAAGGDPVAPATGGDAPLGEVPLAAPSPTHRQHTGQP